MSEHVRPGETYIPLARAEQIMQDAQTAVLANVEAAVGVIRATGQTWADDANVADEDDLLFLKERHEGRAEGMSAAADVLRAVIDAMLAHPMRLAVDGRVEQAPAEQAPRE